MFFVDIEVNYMIYGQFHSCYTSFGQQPKHH